MAGELKEYILNWAGDYEKTLLDLERARMTSEDFRGQTISPFVHAGFEGWLGRAIGREKHYSWKEMAKYFITDCTHLKGKIKKARKMLSLDSGEEDSSESGADNIIHTDVE